jgi:integrase
LKQAYKWGFERSLIPTNPAARVKNSVQRTREEVTPFESWEEVEAVAAELDTPDAQMVVFLAATGMRPGELAVLERKRDLDLTGDTPSVSVRWRRTKDGRVVSATKNKKPRRVKLIPRAIEALADVPARIDTKLLFPGAKGGYLNYKNFGRREWQEALDAAGLERRGLYSLRHAFASFAIAGGADTFTLSRVMGTSERMIDETYGDLLNRPDDSVFNALVSFYGDHLATATEAAEAST